MRQRHNTALATTGGGYTRHMSAPLSPGAKWVGAAARGTRPRLPPRPAVGPVRCRQGAEERRRVPAAARLLARKQLRRRAATEGNGKVSCARRHPRRSRRLRTPAATRGDRRSGRQQGRREGGVAAACGEARSDRERAGGGRKRLARAKRRGERRRSKRAWGTVVLTVEGSIRFRGWWSRATRSAACRERMSCLECPACRTNRTVCCTRHLRYQRGE